MSRISIIGSKYIIEFDRKILSFKQGRKVKIIEMSDISRTMLDYKEKIFEVELLTGDIKSISFEDLEQMKEVYSKIINILEKHH